MGDCVCPGQEKSSRGACVAAYSVQWIGSASIWSVEIAELGWRPLEHRAESMLQCTRRWGWSAPQWIFSPVARSHWSPSFSSVMESHWAQAVSQVHESAADVASVGHSACLTTTTPSITMGPDTTCTPPTFPAVPGAAKRDSNLQPTLRFACMACSKLRQCHCLPPTAAPDGRALGRCACCVGSNQHGSSRDSPPAALLSQTKCVTPIQQLCFQSDAP